MLAGLTNVTFEFGARVIVEDATWHIQPNERIGLIGYNGTGRYDGEKVYYQYCPMAFNNKGAYWLSNQSVIRNPYFGNEMLECGKVEDSVDYRN